MASTIDNRGHFEEAAHHGRITLSAMGFDERVFQSDRLRFPSITHWSSPCSNDHPKVSVKAWEVHSVNSGKGQSPQDGMSRGRGEWKQRDLKHEDAVY
jgi:hypothetical protein